MKQCQCCQAWFERQGRCPQCGAIYPERTIRVTHPGTAAEVRALVEPHKPEEGK